MTDSSGKKAPLEGVQIIDLGGSIAGPLAAMLLTDQGAETIRINPPEGPLLDHPMNAVLDRGKTILALDLKSDNGREKLEALLRDADILIENYGPGVMGRLGLDPVRLRERYPHLIIVSLPAFASDDPNVPKMKAYEGILAAMTGQYTDIHLVRGLFGLDPVYTALPLASVSAAVHGATAAVLALRNQKGRGVHIEAPLASAALSVLSTIYMKIDQQPERYDAPRLPVLLKKAILPIMRRLAKRGGDNRQQKFLNIARKSYPALMTSYPCRDGQLLYVFAIDNAKLTKNFLHELGLLEEVLKGGLVFIDPYQEDSRDNLSETSNLSRDWQSTIKARVAGKLLLKPAVYWEKRLNVVGVPCALQRTTEQWVKTPALEQAGIITAVDDPVLGDTRQPGLQVWVSDSPKALAHPNPRSFTGRAEKWTTKRQVTDCGSTPKAKTGPADWLAGITVIDMCSMVAGPVAGRTLAEYGARVIKVESPNPNHGPRMTCWYGLDGNQGKESILLDLKEKAGLDAFKKMVKKADILLTNQMPAAMTVLGLSEKEIRAINPDILLCRLNGYNGPHGGPWDNRPAYDPVLQAASGIMTRFGDPGQPELHAIASCVDALTGYSAAFGMALGLYRKAQDGEGRTIESSLAVAASLIQIPYGFSYKDRDWTEPSGQLAKGETAFNRLYQTKDGWLFLASPQATVSHLPVEIRPGEGDLTDENIALWIARRLKGITRDSALKMFEKAELPAVPVDKVSEIRAKFLTAPDKATLKLIRRSVVGLGDVISVPSRQIRAEGQTLKSLCPAEKPGSSTKKILDEFGLDGARLIAQGAAAEEICDDYLPG